MQLLTQASLSEKQVSQKLLARRLLMSGEALYRPIYEGVNPSDGVYGPTVGAGAQAEEDEVETYVAIVFLPCTRWGDVRFDGA